MAVASKAARQSSVAKAARKPAASKEGRRAKPQQPRKRQVCSRSSVEAFVDAAATRTEQGRIIQANMSKSFADRRADWLASSARRPKE